MNSFPKNPNCSIRYAQAPASDEINMNKSVHVVHIGVAFGGVNSPCVKSITYSKMDKIRVKVIDVQWQYSP